MISLVLRFTSFQRHGENCIGLKLTKTYASRPPLAVRRVRRDGYGGVLGEVDTCQGDLL